MGTDVVDTPATVLAPHGIWVLFSCAFPAGRSTPRVAVWRRLQRAGAVALKSGLYALPATAECEETTRWLAQEARAEGADPTVIRAEIVEGLSEPQIVELFRAARREDYAALEGRVDELGRSSGSVAADRPAARRAIERLRADYRDIRRIDYFETPEGRVIGTRIDALATALAEPARESAVPAAARHEYVGRVWVTRPQPFVDRLACAWLIRRFIDPSATIRYADAPAAGEVAFDMEPATFSHSGNRCTFEVMIEAFGLDGPDLRVLGEIVHEIDLHDGRYARPEVVGVESILTGWHAGDRADAAIEAAGIDLFDGLYLSARRQA